MQEETFQSTIWNVILLFYDTAGSVPENLWNTSVDGPRSIRRRLEAVFGPEVTLILDWYHFCQKVRSFMGILTQDKEHKRLHLREILPRL